MMRAIAGFKGRIRGVASKGGSEAWWIGYAHAHIRKVLGLRSLEEVGSFRIGITVFTIVVVIAAGQKRKADYDVSELEWCGEGKGANVCGVMLEVSLVKKSSRDPRVQYFDGKLTDGKKVVRVVCFDAKKRAAFEESREKQKSIGLRKCQVKEKRGEFEVIASTNTEVASSEKKFDVEKSILNSVEVKSLSNLDDFQLNQHVSMRVKVVKIEASVTVTTKDGRVVKKQECKCADGSGSCRLVLWEKFIGCFQVGKCYDFQTVTVRMFEGQKYLSTSSDCKVKECDDIGEIVEELEYEERFDVKGEIVGVKNINFFRGCCLCSNGRVSTVSHLLGRCLKCQSTVKLSKCRSTVGDASVMIQSSDVHQQYHASVSLDMILKICQVDMDCIGTVDIEEKLLSASEAQYTIENKVVVNVESLSEV